VKKTVLVLFGLLLIIFCAKKEKDYYPLFVGSLRVYDIERVTIVGKDTTKQAMQQATKVVEKTKSDYWDNVWTVSTQESNNKPIVAYIKKTKDEITYIPNLKDTNEVIQYRFPLQISKNWVVAKAPTETIIAQVVSLENVKVPVGLFDSCYEVEIKSTKNPDFYRRVWLAPNIGIVKNEIKSITTQNQKEKVVIETGVLTQYNTKPSNK
jgi:DUF3108-like